MTTIDLFTTQVGDALPLKSDTTTNESIYIDAGTYRWRIGTEHVNLVASFEPLAHRITTEDGPTYFIGSQEAVLKSFADLVPTSSRITSSKSPYDRNFITHPGTLGLILDEILCSLGSTSSPPKRILITEPLGNTETSREILLHQLFDVYHVEQVTIANPSILAAYTCPAFTGSNFKMIVSFGNLSTDFIALKGSDIICVRRLDFAGNAMATEMLRLLQLKYPTSHLRLTQLHARHIVHSSCEAPPNYNKHLEEMGQSESWDRWDVRIRLGSTDSPIVQADPKKSEELMEKRRAQMQKMRERAAQAKAAKIVEAESYLTQLQALLNTDKRDRREKKQKQVASTSDLELDEEDADLSIDEDENPPYYSTGGFRSESEFLAALEDARMQVQNLSKDSNSIAPVEKDWSLLEIPDAELSPEQLKTKRRLRMQKNAADARDRIKKERDAQEAARAEERAKLEELRINDFNAWKTSMYAARHEILAEIKSVSKKPLVEHGKKARLQTLVNLADEKDEQGGFGDADADWEAYRRINEQALAEDAERQALERQNRLDAVESALYEYDRVGFTELVETELASLSTILDYFINGQARSRSDSSMSDLHVNVERYRVPEGLFQPTALFGIDQAGLIEIMVDMMKSAYYANGSVDKPEVFLVGPLSAMPGLKDRVEAGLRVNLPIGTSPTHFHIVSDTNAAFQGLHSPDAESLPLSYKITRKEWQIRKKKLEDNL